MYIQETALQRECDIGRDERIAFALAEKGWCVTEAFLPDSRIERLAEEAMELFNSGYFYQAGVGRGKNRSIRKEERSDWIMWLNPSQCTPAQLQYLDTMEALRQTINRILYLGLFEFEAHLAIYPPGCHYRKHLDQFKDSGQRLVTCVLYLNTNWRSADGGQLHLYTNPVDTQRYKEILPIGGRMVCFLSSRFHHAVMPGRTDRLSITGWLKSQTSIN
jgi:SM-20-related protein